MKVSVFFELPDFGIHSGECRVKMNSGMSSSHLVPLKSGALFFWRAAGPAMAGRDEGR